MLNRDRVSALKLASRTRILEVISRSLLVSDARTRGSPREHPSDERALKSLSVH
jgi:hypothetical protein